jgi:hypothetical protein
MVSNNSTASSTASEINKITRQLNSTIKSKEVFDPRIIDNDENKALWNTESVELALKGVAEGYKLKENPYLKSVRGALLRKANLPFKYTEDEIEILKIVIEDKIFFGNNFAKLKDGEHGWQNITLRDYQENLLNRYTNERWNIIMFPRQSGKTTTTVIEIVHFCISNIDKDCVVIAQSDKVVNEILGKIKECFAGLPFFMQPGFVSFNKKGFVLDNGCRLSIGIAAESVVQGFSLDLLYIDEFAYIKPSLAKNFWSNVYPTLINNPKSRCIITSTPNGRNLFFELWKGAELKLNRFKPYRIYWYDVPGRDEQFKLDTIANIGISGWEMGFECSFDTQLKSIFPTQIQKKLREYQLNNEFTWSKDNNPIGNKYNIEFISQDVIQYDLKNDYFLIGIDLSEGLEQDSTTLKIKKIEWDANRKNLVFKSIGIYKNSEISVEDFAEHSMNIFNEFDPNKIQVIVENNTFGGEYFAHIEAYRMYDSTYYDFSMSIFAKFYRKSKNDFEYGIRWNSQNKKLGVKSFSNLVASDVLLENHYTSIEEYLNFGKTKSGTYSAQYGHDDLVMADVSISYFIKTPTIHSMAFINATTQELRYLANDESEEIKKKKSEEEKIKNSIFYHNGFALRNHEIEFQKINQDDDMYILGL